MTAFSILNSSLASISSKSEKWQGTAKAAEVLLTKRFASYTFILLPLPLIGKNTASAPLGASSITRLL